MLIISFERGLLPNLSFERGLLSTSDVLIADRGHAPPSPGGPCRQSGVERGEWGGGAPTSHATATATTVAADPSVSLHPGSRACSSIQ